MQILEIIWTFFKIGVVSFGGGWSIVGIIRNEVVPHWINEQEFLSLIAVAQSTPGPIALNAATMIGWENGGFFTAMAATLSVVAFPVLSILAATYLARFIKLRAIAINESLKIGSIAMMLMAPGPEAEFRDPVLIAMALGAFALAAFTKINALWAIIGSGALNAIAGPAIRAFLGIGG